MSAWWALISVVIAAALVVAYSAAGGAALWRRRENPGRVLGHTVALSGVEGLPGYTDLPPGIIDSYDAGWYTVSLTTSLPTESGEVRALTMAARHRGHPISAAGRRGILAVNGVLSSGRQFVALLTLSPPNNRWRGREDR